MSTTIAKISEIRPDPKQPRKYFKQSALKALARSLQLVGQRTPIEVKRLHGGKHSYEIIDGERRWRACQIAGIDTLRITVAEGEIDPRKQHLLSTISNFHREGHTHIEISDALAYQRSLGETVPVLAENLDRSEAWIYQYLMLQRLTPELKEKMHPECDDAQRTRFQEGVVLASLPSGEQQAIFEDGLRYERGERLPLYRKRAESVQGRVRVGRQMRPTERVTRYDNFVTTLNRHFDIALDLRQKEFEEMLKTAPKDQVEKLIVRLQKLRDDIGVMLASVARAQQKKAA